MAITKIFTVKDRIDHVIDYIDNPEKTDDCKFISGINCSPDTAAEMMRSSYALNDKPLRVEGYHIIQSFAPGEVSADTAHEIGVQLAERMWGEHFQAVVATHLNTDVCHNHIVLCSTSFIDGKRYHSCKKEYQRLRDVSDTICTEYGLSIIENPGKKRYKSFAEMQAEQSGKPTWRTLIKTDVDEAIAKAATDKEFFSSLRVLGYEVKLGKDISVRPPGKERFLRLERNFGEDYSRERIIKRILDHRPARPIARPKATDTKPKKLPPVPKGSILALTRHYLYLFGYYRNSPTDAQNRRMHYLLREDLRKLDSIIEDMRFLESSAIETSDQLSVFQTHAQGKIEELVSQRQPLYRIARRNGDPDAVADTKETIAALNDQIKTLRRQVRQCHRIAERSGTISENIAQIEDSLAVAPEKHHRTRSAPPDSRHH